MTYLTYKQDGINISIRKSVKDEVYHQHKYYRIISVTYVIFPLNVKTLKPQ